ncbi:MAG: hypothetical protein KGY55_00450 [Candidatus Thermoplasmatota archaeon]|nr:hypothetical protein [Candidatus Thermoplasmatota archaeon]
MERDRLSGASEIGSGLADRFLSALEEDALYETCRDVLATYPSMASIWQMANLAFLHGGEAAPEYKKMEQADRAVVRHGAAMLKPDTMVLTYSRSSTVMHILRDSADKHVQAICGEGRPNYEGRQLARELTTAGIDVRYATDAGVLSLVNTADVVLAGADALLQGSVVNKTGSAALALAAGHHDVPLYVASSSYKRFPFVLVRQEASGEVWSDAPAGVTVENTYFEAVPAGLATGFVTENGVQDTIPSFARPVADEIWQLRDELAGRYRLLS